MFNVFRFGLKLGFTDFSWDQNVDYLLLKIGLVSLNLICFLAPPVSRCSGCPTPPHCEATLTWQRKNYRRNSWKHVTFLLTLLLAKLAPSSSCIPSPHASSGASPGCNCESVCWTRMWWCRCEQAYKDKTLDTQNQAKWVSSNLTW